VQSTTNPQQSTPSIPLRSVSKHCAQARLLLRRATGETRDPIEIRSLRDLAGVLQYVIVAIEQLEDPR
jgi:hypothetical protein